MNNNSDLHNLSCHVNKEEPKEQRIDNAESDFRFCIKLVNNLLANLKERCKE